MKISLRPYQQNFINAVRGEFLKGNKRVVGVAPCGAGKTIMTGWMIREALNRGKRSIFFVHRRELITQTAKTFLDLGISFGIISSGAKMLLDRPVQIASVQTLARRLVDNDGKPNQFVINALNPSLLICDECHHILANTYKKVLDAFPNSYLLGVTATPLRMGGITLSDSFDSLVESLSVNELIKLGNLTKFQYFAPESSLDLSKVKIIGGDYNERQLESLLVDKSIIGGIVENYRELADGKSAICYCVNVNHSMTVADAFNHAGITAAHCDGETSPRVRDKLVNDFRRGNIQVLCNAELFGEGFDVPHCQAVILARPTQSLTLFIQQAMRPLRPDPDDPDKVAVIIDHVQNYVRHGLPNDDREWSLIPNVKKKIKCPDCGQMIIPIEKIVRGNGKKSTRKFCPKCGYMFEKGEALGFGGRHAEHVDGNLVEVKVSYDTQHNDDSPVIKKKPTFIEDFMRIAVVKKYKPSWAAIRALEYVQSYEDCLHIADVCGYKQGWAYYKWQDIQAEINVSKTLQDSASCAKLLKRATAG